MFRYCEIQLVGTTMPGDFSESHVITKDGKPFDEIDDFLELYAVKLMNYYETQPVSETLEIDDSLIEYPDRTKDFYRRLFRDGGPTLEFITVASEVLALWIEENCPDVRFCILGYPHNTDPAADVVSIIEEDEDFKVRVSSVKASEKNLQANCSVALEKFRKLESGEYAAEVNAKISRILELREDLRGLNPRDLRLDVRYRVVAAHSEDRNQIQILTNFDTKIPGPNSRRSCVLARVSWNVIWLKLAEKVYARLA